MDGTTAIGSPVAVSSGTASTSTSLALGTHSLTAVFTPTDTTAFSGSTSTPPISYVVNNPSTGGTLMITTPSTLPNGTAGSEYTITLTATGGMPPYHWSVLSGGLPPGLHLNPSTGVISGIPHGTGTFDAVIQVTDSSASPAAQLATAIRSGNKATLAI